LKRIAILSDTHNQHNKIKVPECDILIHCGDSTNYGSIAELGSFFYWFEKQDAKLKIYVPGNHDMWMEEYKGQHIDQFTILVDNGLIYEGISFFGSPWRSRPKDITSNAKVGFDAFSVLHKDIAFKRSLIPSVDFLITHYPPYGILDKSGNTRWGCEALQKRTQEISFKVHCFGHVHDGYGCLITDSGIFINAAMCDEDNNLVKDPVVIDYEEKTGEVKFVRY